MFAGQLLFQETVVLVAAARRGWVLENILCLSGGIEHAADPIGILSQLVETIRLFETARQWYAGQFLCSAKGYSGLENRIRENRFLSNTRAPSSLSLPSSRDIALRSTDR